MTPEEIKTALGIPDELYFQAVISLLSAVGVGGTPVCYHNGKLYRTGFTQLVGFTKYAVAIYNLVPSYKEISK